MTNHPRYAERENFTRVVTWNRPSHVSYPPPSRAAAYFGSGPEDSRPTPETREWRDIWGVTWTDVAGEVFPTGPAIASLHDLDRLSPPNPLLPERMEKARENAALVDRSQVFLAVGHPYFLYEKALNVIGAEGILVGMLAEPERTHQLLDIFMDFEMAIAEQYVVLRPDHVNLMDDYGMQDRLAMSPALWREFFKPRLARLIAFYRSRLGDDVVVSHHSCGHVMPIAADLAEVGVNVLHPVQSTANDLAELRRITSHKLTLAGGIDGQRILPLGTPEDVRAEVFRKMDLLWEGGGYLPMAEKMLGVPEENARAMEEAIREWGEKNVG
jgi:uroporphyrinogen decarboxylase